jgi:hypothetical protein
MIIVASEDLLQLTRPYLPSSVRIKGHCPDSHVPVKASIFPIYPSGKERVRINFPESSALVNIFAALG